MDNLNKGVIYVIRNKTNGKCYVGQAANYVGKNNQSWGAQGRWRSHIKEATCGKQDHCRVLNSAIRKYGPDGFQVDVLVEVNLQELDALEKQFISELNTLVPNQK